SASLAGFPCRHATRQTKLPARVGRDGGENHLERCGEPISIRRSQGEGTTGGECRGSGPKILLEVRSAGKIDGRVRHPGRGSEREVLFPLKRQLSWEIGHGTGCSYPAEQIAQADGGRDPGS